MPIYQYTALTSAGETKTGVVDADTPKAARDQLRGKRLRVTDLEAVREGEAPGTKSSGLSFRRRANPTTIALITRQMATLLEAGIPLAQALSALVEQAEDERMETALRDVREKVTSGYSFGDALAHHPAYFNDMFVNMVRAGEASGTLDVILNRLADYQQNQSALRGKVGAALAYPVIMVVIGIAVVIFLVQFVVPKITDQLLDQQDAATLPLPTTILITASDTFKTWWWLIAILVMVAVGAWKAFLATDGGRLWWDTWKLRIPVFGELLRKTAVSRFTTTFATLLGAGIPALQALNIVKDIVGNARLSQVLATVHDRILEGADIATPIKKSGMFPPVVGYMIAVGEESGQLEDMLQRISAAYDQEVETATAKMTSVMEPIIIVVLASVVGFIVMAIILPIIQLNQAVV